MAAVDKIVASTLRPVFAKASHSRRKRTKVVIPSNRRIQLYYLALACSTPERHVSLLLRLLYPLLPKRARKKKRVKKNRQGSQAASREVKSLRPHPSHCASQHFHMFSLAHAISEAALPPYSTETETCLIGLWKIHG
jgi:hypothetical protein